VLAHSAFEFRAASRCCTPAFEGSSSLFRSHHFLSPYNSAFAHFGGSGYAAALTQLIAILTPICGHLHFSHRTRCLENHISGLLAGDCESHVILLDRAAASSVVSIRHGRRWRKQGVVRWGRRRHSTARPSHAKTTDELGRETNEDFKR